MTELGLAFFLSAWATANGIAMQTGPMTMDQAVTIAERNAFAVRLQKSTVEKQRQEALLALANLGPTIGVNAVYTRFGTLSTVQFAPNTAPIVVSPISNQTATATLTLPIDLAGNLHRLLGANEAQLQATQRSLEASFNDARLSARSAFLAVLRAQALVVVDQESLADAKGRLDQANLEFAQQQIAKIDVDRLDAQVAQANSDLLGAENSVELAKHAFNSALARPIETPVDLVEVSDLPSIPSDPTTISLNAQRARPEVKSLVDQARSLALIARAQESTLDPSLAFTANYGYAFGVSGFGVQSSTASIGLTLGVPIFDSGQTRARVRAARQDEEQVKIQLEQEQLSISQEVRDAFANLASAQARLTNAQRQVSLAEEVFRLAKVRQSAGEGTYVEVIDAESSLATARNGLVSARYDYLLAYSQLQRAVGNDRVDAPMPLPGAPSAGGKK